MVTSADETGGAQGVEPAPLPPAPDPRLRVVEDFTPLARVRGAFELLRMLSRVLRGGKSEFKVAILTDLQGAGTGRWKIRDLQQTLAWLEPTSVNDLVHELKQDGVLDYDSFTSQYHLTTEGRLIAAVISAMTVPALDPLQRIRLLNLVMHMAEAMDADGELVFAQFRSAKAILREDRDELVLALEDGSREAIREAANRLQHHARHMQDLHQEHEAFFARHRGEPLWSREEYEGFQLASDLAQKSADVLMRLNELADEMSRGGIKLDRSDVREFLHETGEKDLAKLIAGLTEIPPYTSWLDTDGALDDLAESLDRVPPRPTPLPEPAQLDWEAPGEIPPDPLEEMALELARLSEATSLSDVVVKESWSVSVARHAALVGAYAGKTLDLPSIDDEEPPVLEEINRAGVWRISKSVLRPMR